MGNRLPGHRHGTEADRNHGGDVRQGVKPQTETLPDQGGRIRVWSLLSRQGDGFWQLKEKIDEKNCEDLYSIAADGKYDQNSVFRFFYPKLKDPPPSLIGDTPNETAAWLGIRGDELTGLDVDREKIYMLMWTTVDGNKTVQLKGFPAPEDHREPPVVEDEAEELLLTFKVYYNAATNYFSFQDCKTLHPPPVEAGDHWVKTDSGGNIVGLVEDPGNYTVVWCINPGLQYHMYFAKESE